jgi:hypothetical protein
MFRLIWDDEEIFSHFSPKYRIKGTIIPQKESSGKFLTGFINPVKRILLHEVLAHEYNKEERMNIIFGIFIEGIK